MDARPDRTHRLLRACLVLLALNAAALCFRSLWIDEFRTYHVISDGFFPLLARVPASHLPSPLPFILPWLALTTFGSNEFTLRLPSLLCVLASAWVLFRFALLHTDRLTATTAAIAYLAIGEVTFMAALARPYAFILLLSLTSLYALSRWLLHGRLTFGAAFVACAALLPWFHPLAALQFLVYPVLYRQSRNPRVGGLMFGAAMAAIGLATAPLVPRLNRLRSLGTMLSDLPVPAWGDFLPIVFSEASFVALLCAAVFALWPARAGKGSLVRNAAPGLCLCAAAATLLVGLDLPAAHPLGLLTDGRVALVRNIGVVSLGFVGAAFFLRRRDMPEWESGWISFLLVWLLAPPTVVVLVSRLTSAQLFTWKYFIVSAPPLGLLTALMLSRFVPPRFLAASAGLMTAAALAHAHLGPVTYNAQDWRSAVAFVRSWSGDRAIPVALDSWYPESRNALWMEEADLNAHLGAPLAYYRVKGPALLLPRDVKDEKMEPYLDTIAWQLKGQRRVAFVTSAPNRVSISWIRDQIAIRPLWVEVYPFKTTYAVTFSADEPADGGSSGGR